MIANVNIGFQCGNKISHAKKSFHISDHYLCLRGRYFFQFSSLTNECKI